MPSLTFVEIYPDQEDRSSNPRQGAELGNLTRRGRPWSQEFYSFTHFRRSLNYKLLLYLFARLHMYDK